MNSVVRMRPAGAEDPGARWGRSPNRRVAGAEPAVRTNAVYVIFTSVEETLGAMRIAGDLARELRVPVTIVHFRTVPYALPVEGPMGISPVETETFVEQLREQGLDVRARVYLCRDRRRTLPLAFKPHSLIVVGGRRCWWPTESRRLRRMLEAAGHRVLLVEKEPSHA